MPPLAAPSIPAVAGTMEGDGTHPAHPLPRAKPVGLAQIDGAARNHKPQQRLGLPPPSARGPASAAPAPAHRSHRGAAAFAPSPAHLHYPLVVECVRFPPLRSLVECVSCVRWNACMVVYVCNLMGHSIGFVIVLQRCRLSIGKVRVKHLGTLITLKGSVIRSGGVKMIEYEREYMCNKCGHR